MKRTLVTLALIAAGASSAGAGQSPAERQDKSLNLTAYAELLRSDVRAQKVAILTEAGNKQGKVLVEPSSKRLASRIADPLLHPLSSVRSSTTEVGRFKNLHEDLQPVARLCGVV